MFNHPIKLSYPYFCFLLLQEAVSIGHVTIKQWQLTFHSIKAQQTISQQYNTDHVINRISTSSYISTNAWNTAYHHITWQFSYFLLSFLFYFNLHNIVLYFYLTPFSLHPWFCFSHSSPFEALKWTSAGAPVTRLPVSLLHLFLKWHFQQLGTPGTSPPSIRSLSVWLALCSPGFQRREKHWSHGRVFLPRTPKLFC